MKRTLAIFLTLLLLLPLVGCKEAKNYTVKEVDGKKRIFLNQNEIDRIEREIEEKSWSVTELVGFSDEDCTNQFDRGTSGLTEKNWGEVVDFAAKCRLEEKPRIFRFDCMVNGIREVWFATVCVMKIEKIFYTDGDEKEGDIVGAVFTNLPYWGNIVHDTVNGSGIEMNLSIATIIPAIDTPFYTILQRLENTKLYSEGNILAATKSVADFLQAGHVSIIENYEENVYEFNDMWSALLDDASSIPEEKRKHFYLNYRLDTDVFDERYQAVVDKYFSK